MERLHKLLADAVRNKGGTHTVIHSGRGGGWTYVVVPVVVGGAVTYVYCRITGRSVMDLFFVTNRTLSDFRTSVTESIKVRLCMQQVPQRHAWVSARCRIPLLMSTSSTAALQSEQRTCMPPCKACMPPCKAWLPERPPYSGNEAFCCLQPLLAANKAIYLGLGR